MDSEVLTNVISRTLLAAVDGAASLEAKFQSLLR